MASPAPATAPVGPSSLITVKVLYNENTRRFKLPLRELGARTLPQNLRQLLGVPEDVNVIFERYSDSAGCYIQLDSENPAVYKQLYRAAKAKLKLRIKATTAEEPASQSQLAADLPEQQNASRYSYLETVLGAPLPESQVESVPASASLSASALPEVANGTIPAESRSAQWSAPETTEPQFRDFVLGQDSLDMPVVSHASPNGVFCIDCNHCGRSIPNEHYHCSICDDGDYDLCLQCVEASVACLDDEHWLIKRLVKDGQVTNSTTETVQPRKAREEPEPEEEEEETFEESVPELVSETTPVPAVAAPELPESTQERICNDCLKELDETKMVSCADCDDYDICITCLLRDTHGHHPAHTFKLLHDRQFCLKSLVQSRCKPGRHHHHAAICDGCEKRIIGVRHKCLTCPDWDYCSECHQEAAQNHPGHRFAPIYDAIAEPLQSYEVHYGIYCDGPLCRNRPCPSFITGTRYKCSVCHDTDFCAKCEVHPTNTHNRTHPMVMLKTPVHNVSVSTVHEDRGATCALGDRAQKSTSTQASVPVEPVQGTPKLEAEPIQEPAPVEQPTPVAQQPVQVEQPTSADPASGYQAFFIRDTVPDDTTLPPNTAFEQTWTLFNPGPLSWPAGTDVRFVGGDSMFNVNTSHPLSMDAISAAMESNKLSEPLEPGHSADFTVTLRTPSRQGSAISYWRLKLPSGMPFGHRLWCDVRVRDDIPPPAVSVPEPELEKTVEPQPEAQSEPAGSQMIFPKLAKESPETSTHEAATTAPSAPSVTNASEQDVFDDMESLTLGEDETDAGMLTDEEYDILDASDQEYLEAKSQR
ncbi:ZZ type zinc finger domain protein [Aspergillus piperis CBS 112811]|uniref:ZZ type zinc finger domain protein n=1 Tax=Aspergillus piperis CBS 112811 TaxID=1448313 RepID=A0A8G1VN52_9EURO|nr:ZZ type zinc finger domain protein [Aspergillus piperis CBS 112811]RAH58222.1 ZZ type zinc finger domain protein [Aspergillus piperis CBS 112811]